MTRRIPMPFWMLVIGLFIVSSIPALIGALVVTNAAIDREAQVRCHGDIVARREVRVALTAAQTVAGRDSSTGLAIDRILVDLPPLRCEKVGGAVRSVPR